jgi:hypothetical protein
LTFNSLNLLGFIGLDFFVKSDAIFSNVPFGTFDEPKGSEGDRILNDSD